MSKARARAWSAVCFVLIGCGAPKAPPAPAPTEAPLTPPLAEDVPLAAPSASAEAPPAPPKIAPIRIAVDQRGPQYLAVDQEHAYWLAGNSVMKVAKDGGEPVELARVRAGGFLLLLDDANVYVHTPKGGLRVPKAGGTPEQLPDGVQPGAIDATNYYWIVPGTESGTIELAPRAGGASRTLATVPHLRAVTADSSGVYFLSMPWRLSAAKKKPDSDGYVAGVKPSGGKPFLRVENLMTPTTARLVRTDAENIYWISDREEGQSNGAIVKVAKAGGTPVVVANQQPFALRDYAFDDSNVYWVTSGEKGTSTGTVWKVSKAGGTPAALVSGRAYPLQIAVDDKSVYWTEDPDAGSSKSTGSVWKIAK